MDRVLAGSTGILYIHYGSPMVTAANTVLVAVRTSSGNTYSIEAHSGADGSLLYTLPSDYTPPPHNWIPSYGAALSQGTRLYYPGAGGTVYYRDQPDALSGSSGQIAFYGNTTYSSNPTPFNSNVMISTPITADASGNIYFGFVVTGNNPANLTSGLARIAANGTGSWVSAAAAAGGDSSIVEVAMNCAPAISRDGATVYVGVSGGNGTGGYLVALNSSTLAPVARARLTDPETHLDALLLDDSSASPTVGPDGDVYYGALESSCCGNDDRGWLLHFDSTLAQVKTPGAFGWDTTASVVPAQLVPSYHGPSTYLLFTKYNNYFNTGPGGNGQNKIAVLDPNGQETDPVTGATVMNEVITALGPTPSQAGGVREWCINSGAIDPFSASAIANSEDGVVYRWDFGSNSFTQQVRLTPGVGEAYTPSLIGADGTAYAINDGYLFAVGQASNLTIVGTHAANFSPGQSGAQYTLVVTNSGSEPTSGTVAVIDILPAGLTGVSISGSGWNCTQPAGPCARADVLNPGASYANIVLTVAVSGNPPSMVTNTSAVSADGAGNSVNSISNDVTYIGSNLPAPVLSISKSHNGNFSQGQPNATYTVVVSNAASAGPASGKVTVSEFPPAPLSLVSMSGPGWTCPPGNTCSRGDSLAGGASYPPLTVTVSVANTASSPQVNMVSVSGGGSATNSTTDSATINPVYTEVTVQTSPPGLMFTIDGGSQLTSPQYLELTLGTHTIAVPTVQPGPIGVLYLFSSWSDGGDANHTITVGNTSATYTASFNTKYELTITAAPPAGGNVSPSNGSFYDPGTVVTVGASANNGYAFTGWTGPVVNAGAQSTTVTMSGPVTVAADFVKSSGMTINNCSASSFAYTIGQAAAAPPSITCTLNNSLNNLGIAGLSVTGLPAWLSSSLGSTILTANGSTTLILTPTNLAGLSPGTLGPVTILVTGTPSGGGSASATLTGVTLTVSPQILVNPTSLSFDLPTQAAPVGQTVTVTDNPVITQTITATPFVSAGGNWLAATGGSTGNTPLISTVTVSAAALAQGTYTGSVQYAAGASAGAPSVTVSLNVGQLAVSGGPIIFNSVIGVTLAGPPILLSVSAGPAAINWVSTNTGDCAWLNDSATSGTTPRGGSSQVMVGYTNASAQTVGVGTHVCTLSFAAAANYGSTAPPVTTTITLNVYPTLNLSPQGQTFDVPTLSGPVSQSVAVTATPSGTVAVTATPSITTPAGGTWLSATGGNTPYTSSVTVNAGSLAMGTYLGSVAYATGSTPPSAFDPVILNVGQLTVIGGPINFTHVLGLTTPASASLAIGAGPAAINWASTANGDCAWLTDSASSGTTPRGGSSPVTIGYTAAGAAAAGAGNHVCTLSFAAAASYGSTAQPITTTVTLAVINSPVFTVTPAATQNVSAQAGNTTAVCATYNIDTTPSNGALVTVAASASNPAGLFSANLANPTVPTSLMVCANPTGLLPGAVQGSFTISSAAVANPATVTLNLVVTGTCAFTAVPTSTVSLTNAVPADGSTPITATGTFSITPNQFCTGATNWTATSNASWLVLTSGTSGNGANAVTGAYYALSDPLTGCNGAFNCSGPQPRTANITITPSIGPPIVIPVTQPGSTAPILDRQVTALYQSILGRDPDSGGYSFWTGSGTASLSQMADDFLTSPEAFNTNFAVMAAYQAATGAPPTYAQFSAAVAAIRLNQQTVPGLFGSLVPASGFTAATLYQNLLNRAPTAAESSACTPLAACFQTIIGYPSNNTPVGAASNEWQSTGTFANTVSATGDHTNALYINMLYFVILNRDPDAGGLQFWTNVANNGGAGVLFQGAAGDPARLQILGPGPGSGFIGSTEFQSLFQ